MSDALAEPHLLALAGDWHGNADAAVAAIAHARRAGATTIVQLGDFGDRYAPGFIAAVDAALAAPLETDDGAAGPAVLLFIDGNHERFDLLDALPRDERGLGVVAPRIRHLPRGTRWRWAGLEWVACGGATSVNRLDLVPGESWWPQEALTAADLERVRSGGPADVLVCHDSPAGAATPCDWAGRFPEAEVRLAALHRELVRAVVDAVRPAHLLHGHFHVRYETALDGTRIHGLDRDGAPLERNLLVLAPGGLREDGALPMPEAAS